MSAEDEIGGRALLGTGEAEKPEKGGAKRDYDRLYKMLHSVLGWLQCDLKENGSGPGGGYQMRVDDVRLTLDSVALPYYMRELMDGPQDAPAQVDPAKEPRLCKCGHIEDGHAPQMRVCLSMVAGDCSCSGFAPAPSLSEPGSPPRTEPPGLAEPKLWVGWKDRATKAEAKLAEVETAAREVMATWRGIQAGGLDAADFRNMVRVIAALERALEKETSDGKA